MKVLELLNNNNNNNNNNNSSNNKNVDLKQEIHVIIQSKHFCLLDFSLRI